MLNETISTAGYIVNTTANYISGDLYTTGKHIITAPFTNQSMLWMLLPLLATLLLMEFYFGRYKDEEVGWNTAFGNSLVLSFVAIDLFRYLYGSSEHGILEFIATSNDIKILIPLVIATLAAILILIDFFHSIPEKIAYAISSPMYVNLIGLLGIIVVYTESIKLDWTTLLASMILFIIANIIMVILYYIVPNYEPTISKIITLRELESDNEKKESKKKD